MAAEATQFPEEIRLVNREPVCANIVLWTLPMGAFFHACMLDCIIRGCD